MVVDSPLGGSWPNKTLPFLNRFNKFLLSRHTIRSYQSQQNDRVYPPKITSDFILNPGRTEIAQKINDTVNAVK